MTKKIYVSPLKDVDGVKFGTIRSRVRKEYGKYTEVKGNECADDFGFCKAYYDDKNKLKSVEILEGDVYVKGKKVYPDEISELKDKLGLDDNNISAEKSIKVEAKGSTPKSISFGIAGIFNEKKSETDDSKKEEKKATKSEGAKPKTKEFKEDAVDLDQFYTSLKKELSDDNFNDRMPRPMGYPGMNHNKAMAWRNKACRHRDCLRDKCNKHILLDIYMKVLPLDDDWKCGHVGQMKDDVDNMLNSKGMSATQYLTSASNATKAPLLEYVLRGTDGIGRLYMEEADDKVKDAEKNNIDIPDPEEPSVDDDNIQSQLIDVKDDTEYETFVDQLKKKTIDKIVDDVTKIINKEKEENDMEFNPNPEEDTADAENNDEPPAEVPNAAEDEPKQESAVSIAVDAINYRLIKEGIDMSKVDSEEVIGLAIREATINQIDKVFKMCSPELSSFRNKLALGKGAVITESGIMNLVKDSD